MANTIDLDPEWGAIDLMEEVEAAFGIRIADHDAEKCYTVGDLYEVICKGAPGWDEQQGNCGSSMVFYRIRRALAQRREDRISPQSPLMIADSRPARLFRFLARETGLRLPSLEPAWLGKTGSFMTAGGVLAAIVALLTGQWMILGVAILIAVGGLPLLRLDPGRLPDGMATVADLVRQTAPLNSEMLSGAGGRPSDGWQILVALAAEHGTLAPEKIGPDTFLHKASLGQARAG